MLNNVQLTDATMAILRRELGDLDPDMMADELENVTDTRDTLRDFAAGAHELKTRTDEFQGTPYHVGTIQRFKGKPRETFVFIPQGDWNIVYISFQY